MNFGLKELFETANALIRGKQPPLPAVASDTEATGKAKQWFKDQTVPHKHLALIAGLNETGTASYNLSTVEQQIAAATQVEARHGIHVLSVDGAEIWMAAKDMVWTSTSHPLSPKQAYAFAAVARLMEDGETSGIRLAALHESSTEIEKRNTALLLVACKDMGLLVKNEFDLKKSVEAYLGNTGKEFGMWLGKNSTAEPINAINEQVFAHNSHAALMASINKPTGDLLVDNKIIPGFLLGKRGEVQERLVAIRNAWACGDISEDGKASFPRTHGVLFDSDAFLAQIAEDANAQGITGTERFDYFIATMDERIAGAQISNIDQHRADAKAILDARKGTNYPRYEFDNSGRVAGFENQSGHYERLIADAEGELRSVNTLKGGKVTQMGELNNAVLSDGDLDRAVAILHLCLTRGGLGAVDRMETMTDNMNLAVQHRGSNFTVFAEAEDSDLSRLIESLRMSSAAINMEEITRCRRAQDGKKVPAFEINSTNAGYIDDLIQGIDVAAKFFDEAAEKTPANQPARIAGLRKLARGVRAVQQFYHEKYDARVQAILNPDTTATAELSHQAA